MKLNGKIRGVGGFKLKNHSWGRYGYFWNHTIMLQFQMVYTCDIGGEKKNGIDLHVKKRLCKRTLITVSVIKTYLSLLHFVTFV